MSTALSCISTGTPGLIQPKGGNSLQKLTGNLRRAVTQIRRTGEESEPAWKQTECSKNEPLCRTYFYQNVHRMRCASIRHEPLVTQQPFYTSDLREETLADGAGASLNFPLCHQNNSKKFLKSRGWFQGAGSWNHVSTRSNPGMCFRASSASSHSHRYKQSDTGFNVFRGSDMR